MDVAKIMTAHVRTLSPTTSARTAAAEMWDGDCGFLPVVDPDGHVIGVVTDRDLCMAAFLRDRPLREITVGDVMSQKVISCRANDTIDRAEQLMATHQVRRLPVEDPDGRLAGVISLNDIARASRSLWLRRDRRLRPPAVTRTLAAVCAPRSTNGG